MNLYHFTSADHLAAIARHGLTVGDVPTDIRAGRGRVGVWLTSNPDPVGHGIENSATDKQRYRLTITCLADDPVLKSWPEWSRRHVKKETLKMLHSIAGAFDSWFVYFGHIKLEAITECKDMQTGEELTDWAERFPIGRIKPVPYSGRQRWHKALMKRIQRISAKQQ